MGFFEIPFPIRPNKGSLGGPGFSTSVVRMDSKQERRVARWSQANHSYDVACHIRKMSDITLLRSHYLRVNGPANGFLFLDDADYTSTDEGRLWGDPTPAAISHSDQNIGTGDGTITQFQLTKEYGDSGPIYTRTIKKPITGTVLVGINGINQVSGWTVDVTTGIVTFTTAPAAGEAVSAGYQFNVPVRFGLELDEMIGATIDSFGTSSVRSVPLIELPEESPADEHFNYGGAYDVSFADNITINMGHGRMISLDPTVAGKKVFLPAKADVPFGGPIFTFYNRHASNSVILEDSDTSLTFFTLPAARSITVWLGKNSSQNPTWYGLESL